MQNEYMYDQNCVAQLALNTLLIVFTQIPLHYYE